MPYVKFSKEEDAKAYLPKLQAHHDASGGVNERNKAAGIPKIVDAVFPTFDGQWALTLHDATWPETSGIIVDNVDPPKVEEKE